MKAVAVAALLVAGSLPLLGQMNTTLRAEIPFPFEVANRVMPAGAYTFGFLDGFSLPVVSVKDGENITRSTALSMPGWDELNREQTPAIVFNRYGDRQFLAGLTWPGKKYSVQKSSNEKELVTSRVVQTARREEVRIIAQKK